MNSENYIKRDMESLVLSLSEEYSCILISGPRQVGKSTMLQHIMKPDRNVVTLDDLNERALAKADPEMFLTMHPAPVLIDEVQYAPELFSYIKIKIDNGAPAGSYWLTGSQAFKLMKLAQESLAGRVALLHLSSISQNEFYGSGENRPFTVSIEEINRRSKERTPADVNGMFERVFRGTMPGHISGKYTNRDVFYSSYLQTYLERDVSEMIEGVDKVRFLDFIRAAACRAGQQLNTHAIAADVGVADDTAARWLEVLEKTDIIFYLRPYSNNLLKRTVKIPKMYFFDTGLVAYLTRYSSPEILANGSINGAILENYIVSEIRKTYLNAGMECYLHYYRDKDTKEIDLIIESDGFLHPLEIKKAATATLSMVSNFSVLAKASVPTGLGGILCMKENITALNKDVLVIPAWTI